MKKIVFLFSCFFIISGSLFAQIGDKLSFQMIVRDSGGELLESSPIGLRFKIMQDTDTGTVVFEETHTTTTNNIGIVTVKIGTGTAVIGTISAIDWTTGLYFISTEIDPQGGTTYTLQQTTELNSVPFASSASKAISAATLDYNSLTNKPVTISANESAEIDFISVTNAIDLNSTKTAVDLNTLKVGFPGFGTTAGTAFEVLWSKVGNNAFFTTGTVGIGTNTDLDTSAASLIVQDGIVFPANPSLTAEIGTLDYTNLAPTVNDFFYADNLGNPKLYNGNNDIVFISTDVNILGNLGIGSSINSSYNFNDNNFAIVSATPNIFFQDTSSSASFPSADWRIRINDLADGGDNYFSLENVNDAVSTFKIMANSPTNVFKMLANGNIGFLTATPTEALEIPNVVSATSFTGDSSNLTNIPAGSASISNIGSTTIGADTNIDSIGALIFETQNLNRMSIQSNGDTAIGAIMPTANFEVDGNVKMDGLVTETLKVSGSLSKTISVEAAPASFTAIDILDKSVIIFNTDSSNNYFSFINGKEGQVFTIINSGFGTHTFYNGGILSPGPIAIPQNGSITFVQSGNSFIVTAVVN
ncbi:MAG: hypothetical protein ACPG6B_02680 [Oceanihabitans sp.]